VLLHDALLWGNKVSSVFTIEVPTQATAASMNKLGRNNLDALSIGDYL
jgi:hypothetical protein